MDARGRLPTGYRNPENSVVPRFVPLREIGAVKTVKRFRLIPLWLRPTDRHRFARRPRSLRRRGDKCHDLTNRDVNVFISSSADDLAALADVAGEAKGNVRLLVLDGVLSQPRREYLETLFRTVISPDRDTRFLGRAELVEAICADNRDALFIGGTVNTADEVVILYRGNLARLVVSFSWFIRPRMTERPDFSDFDVADHGQTVRFGRFEASTDAILYAFDADYRRRAKRRQLELDDSFGAALRRLRLLRALSRRDFAPLSAKSIARIERGDVARPRDATLRRIARKLQVEPEDIGTY